MAKLRHVGMSAPDPEVAAKFYCEAFEMEVVRHTDSPPAGAKQRIRPSAR